MKWCKSEMSFYSLRVGTVDSCNSSATASPPPPLIFVMQVNLQNEETKKSLGLCSESTFVFISLPYSWHMALVNTRRCVSVLQMFRFFFGLWKKPKTNKKKMCSSLTLSPSFVSSVPLCFVDLFPASWLRRLIHLYLLGERLHLLTK